MKNVKVVFVALICTLFLVNLSHGQSWRDKFQKPSAPTHAGVKKVYPDLIVTNISLISNSNKTRYTGRNIPVPVNVTIRNIGGKSISYRENFDIHLSGGNSSLFVRNRRTINPRQSVTFRMDLVLSDFYNGKNVDFTAVVDRNETTDDVYSDSIKESNERNNSKRVFLQLPLYRKR